MKTSHQLVVLLLLGAAPLLPSRTLAQQPTPRAEIDKISVGP